MPAASTRASICLGPGRGVGTLRTPRCSKPVPSRTTARISAGMAPVDRDSALVFFDSLIIRFRLCHLSISHHAAVRYIEHASRERCHSGLLIVAESSASGQLESALNNFSAGNREAPRKVRHKPRSPSHFGVGDLTLRRSRARRRCDAPEVAYLSSISFPRPLNRVPLAGGVQLETAWLIRAGADITD